MIPLHKCLFAISLTAITSCMDISYFPISKTVDHDAAHQASTQVINTLAPQYPGISAAVFKRGQLVWTAQRGFADREKQIAVSEETTFNIYSTSKALTAFAIARLIEREELQLDGTLGEAAPNLLSVFHAIKISDILSHRSGIRHYNSPKDWLRFAQLKCKRVESAVQYFAMDQILHTPGEKETYSTFAFILLSEILTRKSMSDNFETSLNLALGDWADFKLDGPDVVKASMYIDPRLLPTANGKDHQAASVKIPHLSAECKFGGGGIVASPRQLAEAGAEFAVGNIIPLDRLDTYLRSSPSSLGGAFSVEHHGDRSTLSYELSGGAPGGRSYLLVLMEPQISVAIAGNFDGPNLKRAAHEIAKSWMVSH